MLARGPANRWISDCDARRVVWEWCELAFACPESSSKALVMSRRMKQGHVGVGNAKGAEEAVEEEQSNGYPDVYI
jgi:hypothetical protein